MFKKGDILSQDTLVGYYPMCAENYSEIDLKNQTQQTMTPIIIFLQYTCIILQ